jgi:hypothetical protein
MMGKTYSSRPEMPVPDELARELWRLTPSAGSKTPTRRPFRGP